MEHEASINAVNLQQTAGQEAKLSSPVGIPVARRLRQRTWL